MPLGRKVDVGPGDIVSDETQLPPNRLSSPIIGPYLLSPNGSMEKDATWYGGGSRPRRHCFK